MKRGKMSNPAEMETNAITTSSTGVVTTMPFLHRNIRDTSQDSLLTVSGGLSTTGALVTPDLVDSSAGTGEQQQGRGDQRRQARGDQQWQGEGEQQWQGQEQGRGDQQWQGRGDQQLQGRDQQWQGQSGQELINWGGSRDISTPWCRHVHNCLQGRFCVLRNYGDQDFTSQPFQGRH